MNCWFVNIGLIIWITLACTKLAAEIFRIKCIGEYTLNRNRLHIPRKNYSGKWEFLGIIFPFKMRWSIHFIREFSAKKFLHANVYASWQFDFEKKFAWKKILYISFYNWKVFAFAKFWHRILFIFSFLKDKIIWFICC